MNPNAKTIPVKLYMSADAYCDIKSKCDAAGISMSAAGNLAFRQWQPVHRIRREGRDDRPRPGLHRALSLPGSRAGHGGAQQPHLRV